MSSGPILSDDVLEDFAVGEDAGPEVRGLTGAEAAEFVEQVRQFFSAGGPLARGRGYEFRPQQQEMAVEVARALAGESHVVVEAGTGVGKSLAYLVPAMVFARKTGRRALLCTHTINLQEQLWQKDIPLAAAALGFQPKAALLKGRSNYLCGTRLKRSLREPKDLFSDGEFQAAQKLLEWAQGHAVEGTRSELERVDEAVWSQVCSEKGSCSPKLCNNEPLCFYQRARRQAMQAELLVLNHTLFFTLLGAGAPERGFLREGDFAIFDEAHTLEDVASTHLGVELSEMAVRQALLRLYNERTQKGLLQLARLGRVIPAVSEARTRAVHFFDDLERALGMKKGGVARVTRPNVADGTALLEVLRQLAGQIRQESKKFQDALLQAELENGAERLLEVREAVSLFLAAEEPEWVYWVEENGRRERNMSLHFAPLDVSELLGKILFRPRTPCILASATLATGKGMEFFMKRVGGTGVRSAQIGSPFDYKRQMRLHIVRSMPEPTEPRYLEELAKWVWHFVERNQARALVLFTSYKDLAAVAERLESKIASKGWELLAQTASASRSKLLESFRGSKRGAVLFGAQSFWTGVDVPGQALSCLVITRLPFQPPDHPLTKARHEAIRKRGGNDFMELSVPEAVLQFRQGVGRLIRSASDRGMVAILDSRIVKKFYGREFLAALPECPKEFH